MAEQRELLTREAFMDALETQWGRYVPTVEALTMEDRQQYARRNGYDSLKDLLAHLTAWMQEARRAIAQLSRGERYHRDWSSEDAFNARAVELARNQTLDQVKADFETARTALAGLIAELPVEAVSQPVIYNWLYETIITHYRDHEPPGDPQVPAEQHVVTE
ncbi:MAG: ClbS/DfsB family four-helix bundle protein [Chloroflexi bacterium]|nr:ClbS/DfsB family four-helix bundle protein [Chloroflexota bacterium]